MNFKEAMEKLQAGKKVTRQEWMKEVYFCLDGTDVKSYQPKLAVYIYNEDIMVSTGWKLELDEEEYSFSDIVIPLKDGAKAHLKDWKEGNYIYLDKPSKILLIHTMEELPYSPDFLSFVAEDWIEVT